LVSLHLVMKAPVWDLVSRIDLTGGSSGYHRYQLIDQCIRHFWDWAFVGTKDFGNWGWDMWDLSNQYVAAADTTGLVPLILFLVMIVVGFRYVGRARRASSSDRKQEMFIWALGASMFANVVAFFGIAYFDQTIIAWYGLLAMIAAAAVTVRRQQREKGESKESMPGPFSREQEAVETVPASMVDSGLSELRFSQGSWE
jgi:hypothetical protein